MPRVQATPFRSPSGDLHRKLDEVISELVGAGLPLQQARDEFERQYVLAALREKSGGISSAAEHLGVHRNTLRKKVALHGIRPVDYSS